MSFKATAPTLKSFSCSRQGGEDCRCLANWGIQAKGLAGKNVTVGKSNGNRYFPKGMLVNMQGSDTILSLVWMLPSHSNFTRSQVHSRSKRLSLDDMSSSFMEKITFHRWGFVSLWSKILARFKDSTFADVNYKFPGISVLIDNQSFS